MIPGSYWGEPEAGLVGKQLYLRPDTPVHSALHEACHWICMDDARRAGLHTDAGGTDTEENAVCYLQCLLAEQLRGYSRAQVFADMDAWGYNFILGSAAAWFAGDVDDAVRRLLQQELIDAADLLMPKQHSQTDHHIVHEEDPPRGVPPGTIQIDPSEGFGPHMSEDFLDLYGEGSVFVTATVDCLTWRYIKVLIKAEKLSEDFEPTQYGSPEMRQTLEAFLKALAICGLEKPSVTLMRSALGREQPRAFQDTAGALLGSDLVARWLHLLEQEDYAAAMALLSVH